MRYVRALAAMVGLVLVWAVVAAQIPTTSVVTEAGPPPSSLSAAIDAAPVVSLAVVEAPLCKYPCENPKPTTPPPTSPKPTIPDYDLECGTLYLSVTNEGTSGYTYSFATRIDSAECETFLDPVMCSSSYALVGLGHDLFGGDALPWTTLISPADAFPGTYGLNVYCPAGVKRLHWVVQDTRTLPPK